MLNKLYEAKQQIEKNISKMLNQESKSLTEQFVGKHIVYWEDEFSNGQFNQVKKQGTIKKVVIDVDVYENWFVDIGFELTNSYVRLDEIEQIK